MPPTINAFNNQVITANVTFNGGTMNIGSDATDNAINIGTAASAGRTTSIGNTTGTSTLAEKCGTGGYTLASATGTLINAHSTGPINYPLQPCFSAYLGTNVTNATGNGATYTLGSTVALTENFDQGSNFNTNGTFTAPTTGKYFFNLSVYLTHCTIAGELLLQFLFNSSTSALNVQIYRTASALEFSNTATAIIPMIAADTLTFRIIVNGEVGNTDTILNTNTFMAGYLIC